MAPAKRSRALRYYKLGETPAYYITAWYNLLSGKWEFGKVHATETTVEGVTVELTTNGRHTNYEMKLSGFALDTSTNKVYGVVLTAADGSEYGLHHVTNIWHGTKLASMPMILTLHPSSARRFLRSPSTPPTACMFCRSAWNCKFVEGCLIQPTYSTKRQDFLISGDLAVL